MELYNTPAHKLREMLTARQISTVEIVQNFLSRIRSIEQKIKAFITITENVALEQAKAVDKKIATGEKVGKLAGIPIAVKDNICTKDIRTTCASKILGNFISQYDASVIERIKNEDAIIIGKTNMDEFAMGSSCENSAFFPTRNPWNLDTTPGGSSGGSAAAVAAGEAAIALGSDTGGSIRQPAALTGTVGFKPTYGLVSRYGLIAFASSLDQIGPIAKCVDDAILLTEVICGKDPMDSTSVTYNFNPNGLTPVKGLRVGVPKEYFGEGVDREIASAITGALKLLERLGAKLIDVELPLSKYSIATYYIVAPAEASSNLARYDGAHYGYRT
ncbi:MAG: aspartyl/glutamyl-tRNA amidotransferase subunit A, partial [Planctomycetes bacterium RBG_16_43_13]